MEGEGEGEGEGEDEENRAASIHFVIKWPLLTAPSITSFGGEVMRLLR